MKINEISQKTNLPKSTLRYYEKRGLLKVERDANGRRKYDENDIEWIKFIRRLKATGMLLKDIKIYAELRYAGANTMPERLKILQVHRKYVLKQKIKWDEYLENLDYKIKFYEQSIMENKMSTQSSS